MTDITKLPADVASRFDEKFPGKVATFRYVGEEDIKPFVIIDKQEARQFLADELAQAVAEERERKTVYQCSCCGFRSDGIFRIHDCEWTNQLKIGYLTKKD